MAIVHNFSEREAKLLLAALRVAHRLGEWKEGDFVVLDALRNKMWAGLEGATKSKGPEVSAQQPVQDPYSHIRMRIMLQQHCRAADGRLGWKGIPRAMDNPVRAIGELQRARNIHPGARYRLRILVGEDSGEFTPDHVPNVEVREEAKESA